MNKVSRLHGQVLTGHLLFWVVFISIVYFSNAKVSLILKMGDRIERIHYDIRVLYLLLVILPLNLAWVYGQLYWAIPRFFTSQKRFKYLLLSGVMLVSCFLLQSGFLLFTDWFLLDLWMYKVSWLYAWKIRLQLLGLLWGILWLYQLILDKLANEQLQRQLTQEKLTTELAFLKAQINPHFLFNTLNNLYALTRKHSDPTAANSIAQLSKLMRYMLYETNVDWVMLNKEVAYIENFIKLQKLRLASEDDTTITFNISDDLTGFKIAPMLLIPFVENAFKHGISLENKSEIIITIEINDEGKLFFQVKNTLYTNQEKFKGEAEGLGIKNVQQRLELLYPEQYQLEINQTEGWHEVVLHMKLN